MFRTPNIWLEIPFDVNPACTKLKYTDVQVFEKSQPFGGIYINKDLTNMTLMFQRPNIMPEIS